MKIRRGCLAMLATVLFTTIANGEEGWTELFNGKDLTGWTAVDGSKDNWNAEDGILFCKGGGGGWLSTEKEYANFILELEFRVPPGGNSGVFLRSPHMGDPAYSGMEVQVLDDAAKEYANLEPWQYSGCIYKVAAPTKRMSKPAGEWQKYHIECNGPSVKITFNDTLVVDTDLTKHPDKEASHPGIKRRTGYIGLQNHSTRLDYRNIKIKELK